MISKKKFFQLLLLSSGFIILSGLFFLSLIYPLTLGKKSILYSDYGKFYYSQRMLIEKKNIYTPIYFINNKNHNETRNSIINAQVTKPKKAIRLAGNLNPPFFTLITFPIAYLSYPNALLLWTVLSMLAGYLSILLIQQKLEPESISLQTCLLLLIGFTSFYPTFASLQFGQVTLLLLPLLVLGWRAAHDQNPNKAAIFLGLAASLKPFIGLFFLYFLIRKEWRALSMFLLTILISSLIAAAFFGTNTYYSYYQVCQQLNWAASSWNVSIYGFLLRFIGGPEANIPLIPIPGIFSFAYLFLSALFIGALLWLLRPLPGADLRNKNDLDFSITLVAMLLLSPLGWLYYFPFLTIPFLILWNFSKKGIYPLFLPLLLAIFLLLCNIQIPLIPTNQIKVNNVIPVFIGASLCFSVLVGFVVLFFLVRRPLTKKPSQDFERIPSGLLLLVYIVVLLPSLLGIVKSTNNWMHNTVKYSSEYTLLSHQD